MIEGKRIVCIVCLKDGHWSLLMARYLWDWDIVPCRNDCWIELILVDINPDLDLTNNICNRTTCSLVLFYSRCCKIWCWYMIFMMWFGLYIVPVVPSKFNKLVLLISLPKSQNNHQLLTLFIDRITCFIKENVKHLAFMKL